MDPKEIVKEYCDRLMEFYEMGPEDQSENYKQMIARINKYIANTIRDGAEWMAGMPRETVMLLIHYIVESGEEHEPLEAIERIRELGDEWLLVLMHCADIGIRLITMEMDRQVIAQEKAETN